MTDASSKAEEVARLMSDTPIYDQLRHWVQANHPGALPTWSNAQSSAVPRAVSDTASGARLHNARTGTNQCIVFGEAGGSEIDSECESTDRFWPMPVELCERPSGRHAGYDP